MQSKIAGTPRLLGRSWLVLTVAVLLLNACGGPESSLTLGAVLGGLLDQVQSTIRNAGQVGNGVVIVAGSQVYTAIEAAQTAYDAELNKTVDRLDASVTREIDQLRVSVSQLQSGVDASIRNAARQAQQVVLSVPFANRNPQVTDFSPHFVATGVTEPVALRIDGVFAFSQQSGFLPQLHVGPDSFSPVGNTTQELTFQVPTRVFSGALGSTIKLLTASLTVPYESGLLKSKRTANYSLLLGMLPSTPGTLTMMTKRHLVATDSHHFRSRTYKQYSTNDDLTINYSSDPLPAGVRIDPTTVQLITTGPENGHAQGALNDEWSFNLLVNDGHTVTYTVNTVHHRAGTSGKVDFHLEYDTFEARDTTVNVIQPLQIHWGDQITRPATPGDWQIAYDAFDGMHADITNAYTSRYLSVFLVGDSVVMRALPAADVRF
jgi:hypothetical protein